MNAIRKFLSAFKSSAAGVRHTTPAEAARLVASGSAVLVDVREAIEWKEGVAQPAVLLPLSDLTGPRQKWKAFLAQHRQREIILYCQAGGRAATAGQLLAREGYRVANVGGLGAWVAAGLPTRTP